jgi:hypothetical protein
MECFPNPFNPAATIRFRLPSPGEADLSVHDVAGRLVATLKPEQVGGEALYEAHWDGRNTLGDVVAAGVYFVSLDSDAGSATAKLALVK